ncbi:MAG: endonuclease III [Candidatus Kapaibacteriota bacterium]|jgi:endonuclease-3
MNKFSKSIKSKKSRQLEVINVLEGIYPDIKIQLNHSNPFELLIATILSAQCTDARVNMVTPFLFAKYPNPIDYVNANLNEIEKDIFSTGFYKNKAKNIQNACKILVEKFNSQVPNNMDDLTSLAGVGRKTANVVLSHSFDIPGVVVDTHVTRISNLLGFVETEDAVKIEYELMKLIPKEYWVKFTHYYINLGRDVCIARRPKCGICPISHLCPSSKV